VSTTKPQGLVVRLLDGRSEQQEIVFEAGQSRPPVALGSASPSVWCVDAAHIAAVHVLLAFNGVDLYVSAVPGELALLNGEPLGALWALASVPSELRFGSARLSIAAPAVPALPAVAALEEGMASPLAVSVRVGSEEHTSTDAHRLAEALRLSTADAELPTAPQVARPAIVRRPRQTCPWPPLRRPAIRAVDPTTLLLRGLQARSQ